MGTSQAYVFFDDDAILPIPYFLDVPICTVCTLPLSCFGCYTSHPFTVIAEHSIASLERPPHLMLTSLKFNTPKPLVA